MPVYNKETTLEGAIQSVLQQTYGNFHLVIIDDCSSDGTRDILKKYESFPNITILYNDSNKGCYYTRNRGLYEFKDKEWDIWTIHDSDDVSDINRFSVLLDEFISNPFLKGLKTTYIRKDYQTQEYHRKTDGEYDIYTGEGIAFYHRDVFNMLGYYDDTRFGGDTEYMRRFKAYLSLNPRWVIGSNYDILYVAYLNSPGEENLTLKYNFTTSRPPYYSKINADIEQRLKTNQFYKKIWGQ
jgi:glycosyltransferase involved in cell wall biosynthesis